MEDVPKGDSESDSDSENAGSFVDVAADVGGESTGDPAKTRRQFHLEGNGEVWVRCFLGFLAL